jgi:hypothetical protein
MKGIARVVLVTALAFSAQAAWSDEAAEGAVKMESSEAYVNVAAIGSPAETRADVSAAPSARPESLQEKLGLVAHDGFPARGGPIDN